jgi:flavin reductase (DIM6/NTAB) family NADH-FMN oxidoreductase RutF
MDRDSETQTRPADPINRVFHLYDPPLWLVTAAGSRRGGCIATFVVRASIVAGLPRMVLGIAKHHFTWHLIESTGTFALHLLRADDLDAVWRFGLQSGHDVDKLADLPETATPLGSPIYPQAAAWLDCRVEDRLDIGDRTVYLAEVLGAQVLSQGPLLGVETLMRTAPPERRAELDRLYRADQAIDRAAILDWRRSRLRDID